MGPVAADPRQTTRWRCNFAEPSLLQVLLEPQPDWCSLHVPLDLALWEFLYKLFPDLGAPEKRICLLVPGPQSEGSPGPPTGLGH